MNLEALINIFELSNASVIQSTNKIKSQILKNTFGVFATIRRAIKLPSYPVDIHGCIGYWSPDYSILSKQAIISHLIDVIHSALNNDERRNYFPPIVNDPETMIEIDFMFKPLIPINNKTGVLQNGEKFINSKYGLIVDNNNNRATYLPYVFPDTIEWSKLKESLLSKAGIANTTNTTNTTNKSRFNNKTKNSKSRFNNRTKKNNIKFLAYKIIQLKAKLVDVIDKIQIT